MIAVALSGCWLVTFFDLAGLVAHWGPRRRRAVSLRCTLPRRPPPLKVVCRS